MILLGPIYDETIWGGSRLVAGTAAANKKIGHLYSVFDRECSNRIRNGQYAGQSFHTYFARNKERFGLGQYGQYPVVVALVDAADNLSIQVHPDDKTAAVLEISLMAKMNLGILLRPLCQAESIMAVLCLTRMPFGLWWRPTGQRRL